MDTDNLRRQLDRIAIAVSMSLIVAKVIYVVAIVSKLMAGA